jgi:hypothetical protein
METFTSAFTTAALFNPFPTGKRMFYIIQKAVKIFIFKIGYLCSQNFLDLLIFELLSSKLCPA